MITKPLIRAPTLSPLFITGIVFSGFEEAETLADILESPPHPLTVPSVHGFILIFSVALRCYFLTVASEPT
jgi:hypothetical protein